MLTWAMLTWAMLRSPFGEHEPMSDDVGNATRCATTSEP